MAAPRRYRGGRRRKVCSFCQAQKQNNNDSRYELDYKNQDLLRKYISDRGKILPRRVTGTCAKHQRLLTISIKRSRHMAFLPFTKE